MKMSRISIVLCGAALLFSSGALAGETNKTSLRLRNKVSVDGKTINPGRYKLEWDGTGPTVQVKLLDGKQTVTTFAARLTEEPTANLYNAYGTDTKPNGTLSLTSIYVGGKRTTLKLEQKEAPAQSNAHPSS